jgi:acetyl-CoA acetyltransferase
MELPGCVAPGVGGLTQEHGAKTAGGLVTDGLKRAAAIGGIGELRPSRDAEGADAGELLLRVAREAILDAGLEVKDVDGVITAGGGGGGSALGVAEQLGLRPTFSGSCDLAGASAAGMVWRAAAAIASGQARAVVCAMSNAMNYGARATRPPPGTPGPQQPARPSGPAGEFEAPYGPMGPNSGYAMIAARHAYEFGTTDRQRAKVAVDQRTNAGANPVALFREPITVEDVLASRMIVDPLHLLEIVRPCVGGSACVVVSPEVSRSLPHPPVWLLGAGEKVDHNLMAQASSTTTSPIAYTAPKAFEMAGVKPSGMDMLSLYDCYTIMVLVSLEDAGFCAKGSGGPFVADHDLTYKGDLPVNTHGGQLSFGQAALAGGATHITEAVRQLRGEAGERQVPDCELVFVNGNGGIMSEEVSLVLGR